MNMNLLECQFEPEGMLANAVLEQGANGDEGMGFLSWCMDWQYVGTDQLLLPINTLMNQYVLSCVKLVTCHAD